MATAGWKRKAALAALLWAGSLCAGAQNLLIEMSDQPLDAAELFDRVSPSIWVVLTANAEGRPLASGSAVVMARQTLVTNCHVLRDARGITVQRASTVYNAVAAEADPEHDLCLLRVPGLPAPAVTLAAEESLRPGMRVYAVGAPRRLEQTISDGLLSALRRDADGTLAMVQTSAPISPGSSGGGLFDAHGRLIGITSSGLKDSQNLNFAVPARRVTALGRRAGVETAVAQPDARLAAPIPKPAPAAPPRPVAPAATPVAPVVVAMPPAPVAPPAPVDVAPATQGIARIDYVLKDRLTGLSRTVSFRADPGVDAERSFNNGTWRERADGTVLESNSRIAGDFDSVMPPGGWVAPGKAVTGASWSERYSRKVGEGRVDMDITATVAGPETVEVEGRPLAAVRVDIKGYTTRTGNGLVASQQTARYRASAWYAPELGRVVRFSVHTRGGQGGGGFVIDEELSLSAIR